MGERMDEAKGTVKEQVGSLTGNEDMEREGAMEKDQAKAKREAEGAADQAKGKAEETWGDATDDRETEAEGKAHQTEGDAKRTL